MEGYLCLVLHAHLPFVRHPEHDRFLEENWLFEAMTAAGYHFAYPTQTTFTAAPDGTLVMPWAPPAKA